jgi:hypothetical protein
MASFITCLGWYVKYNIAFAFLHGGYDSSSISISVVRKLPAVTFDYAGPAAITGALPLFMANT